MRIVLSVLDVLGVCLVAFGVGAALFPLMGWAAAVVSGVVLVGCARLAEWLGVGR